MSSIRSDNKTHEANCSIAESNRQAAAANGSPAALKASDIAFYRAVIASCQTNGLPFASFRQALIFLGTDGT
jgi:hypothetical protein